MKDQRLLKECRKARERLAGFRAARERCKNFAYGRQWDDRTLLPDGRVMSEEQMFRQQGRLPLTNNLIRQMIKGIIGRYRYLTATEPEGEINQESEDTTAGIRRVLDGVGTWLENLDARALEEFLISGCAVQRVERGKVENVSPKRVFWTPYLQEDGGDCRLIGMTHRMSAAQMVRRFSGGQGRRIAEILEESAVSRPDDWTEDAEREDGLMTVIEVWRRQPRQLLRVFDPEAGSYTCQEYTQGRESWMRGENRRREKSGRKGLQWRRDISEPWEQSWLTPSGTLLGRKLHAESDRPAIVVRLYPMIDGEVHSLVEDVMGQQRQVNRLVMLMDEILNSSAKGVLLFPADQLPRGLTWRNVRDMWRQPGALIPFKRTSRHVKPMQVNTAVGSTGATELLKTHLQMFDDISGTSRLNREHTGNTRGAETLRREMEEAMLSILDVLGSFRRFIAIRDTLLKKK